MSATASLIAFAVFCGTLAIAYAAGYAARASQERCIIEDAKELIKRNQKLLATVEPR